jgi:hypothetical protein
MAQPSTNEKLLINLRRFVYKHPARCFFAPPATDSEINFAESTIGIQLPTSYKQFLRTFNGGFISLYGKVGDRYWTIGHAEWNSNSLFGTGRLLAEFHEQKLIWEGDLGWKGK